MKRTALLVGICIHAKLVAQIGLFVNGADASLIVTANGSLFVNGDFRNLDCDPVKQVRFNGTLYLAGSLVNNDSLKFDAVSTALSKNARLALLNSLSFPSGTAAIISGNAIPKFWEVELNKPGGSVTLNTDIRLYDTLEFKNGLIFLNGRKFHLVDPSGVPTVINHPFLKNERHASRFSGASLTDTGAVVYSTTYDYSTGINPANIGISITGTLDLGSRFEVSRKFRSQVNSGKTGLHSYYDISSPAYALTSQTLSIRYAFGEGQFFTPGYLNNNALRVFISPGQDNNWTSLQSLQASVPVNTAQSVFDGTLRVSLSAFSHPNVNIQGNAFRVTIADSDCPGPPVSAFTSDTLHVCTGSAVTIDAGNNSPVSNSSLRWEWNTSPPSYNRTISVNPDQSYHTYRVLLTDVRGCTARDSVVLAPQAPYPVVAYLNHLNSCLGDSVTIKDTVRILSGTWVNSWSFSDGSSSQNMQQLFKKKFAQTGQHSLQLTATSNYGCSTTATIGNVIVYPLPTASFTHSLDCSTGSVSFSNTSVSNYSSTVISGALWNLGAGASNTTSAMNPSQTYSPGFTYSVQLVSTTNFGCRDTLQQAIAIPPRNYAVFSKNNTCFSDTVFLINNSACNTGSCSYQWDTGDNQQSSAASLAKIYTSAGPYNVKLKVTCPAGCPDSLTLPVFVNPNPVSMFALSSQSVCPGEMVYATNSSSISTGSLGYQWNFGNGVQFSSVNGNCSYSSSGSFTITLLVTSDSGCVASSAANIQVHQAPVAQYYIPDVCHGNPSYFTAPANGYVYYWSFGNSVVTTSQTSSQYAYIYPSPGTYSTQLIVYNSSGCSDTANKAAIVKPAPVSMLNGTVSTCGTQYSLDAGNPGSYYAWQPGNQSAQTVTVTANGTYTVVMTSTNGCAITDAVTVILNAEVFPWLGSDISHCGAKILNAGYPGGNYSWNTGATTQTIIASTTSSYAVMVTDQNGCVGSDSINLVIMSVPSVSLGPDLSSCRVNPDPILTPTMTGASAVLWNTGDTTATLSALQPGLYWIAVEASNGCSARDSIIVNYLTTPQPELGPDRAACGEVLLDAQHPGAGYLWSSGSTGRYITAAQSGIYYVSVTNTVSGCKGSDTIVLVIHPLVMVSLGSDTTVCSNSGFRLSAGNPGHSYAWTSGHKTPTIAISSGGIYGVTVSNSGGCGTTDYINVSVVSSPTIDIGPALRYLCGNGAAEIIASGNGAITWGGEQGFYATGPSVQISVPGVYWATVSANGCSGSDTVRITTSTNTIQAQFLVSTRDTVNKPVQFVNLTTPVPLSQLWEFGDGITSTEFEPGHIYVLPDDFIVSLTVSNGYCTDKLTKSLNVLFREARQTSSPSESMVRLLEFNCYPIPAKSILNLMFRTSTAVPVSIEIADLSGRSILLETTENTLLFERDYDLSLMPNGLYFLTLRSEGPNGWFRETLKLVKTD
jgi:PKD repeat protein